MHVSTSPLCPFLSVILGSPLPPTPVTSFLNEPLQFLGYLPFEICHLSLKLSWKTESIFKVSYFSHEVTCYKSLDVQRVFWLGISISVNHQYIWLSHAASAKRLFHLRGETSCLFTTSVWQGIKKFMLPIAFGFPEDMSHRCFGIGGPRFLLRLFSPWSQSVSLNWV